MALLRLGLEEQVACIDAGRLGRRQKHTLDKERQSRVEPRTWEIESMGLSESCGRVGTDSNY